LGIPNSPAHRDKQIVEPRTRQAETGYQSLNCKWKVQLKSKRLNLSQQKNLKAKGKTEKIELTDIALLI
jgi:hypothetical protein